MDLDTQNSDPAAALAQIQSRAPQSLQEDVAKLQQLYERRLWHQLTVKLLQLTAKPDSSSILIDLQTNFISTFAKHLNQLDFVRIATLVAQQYSDPSEALSFLDRVTTSVDVPEAQQAFVLATMESAQWRLLLGQLNETQAAIAKCEAILSALDSVESAVSASFYRVSADYYKAQAEYSDYYKNALLYLACIDSEQELSNEQQIARARDLSLAALLGSTIYNFGELLLHPILTILSHTEDDWMRLLLFAFNEGAIGKFESLVPQFSREPLLQENYPFLRQKICLMALIEAVFRRPAGARILPFSTIAQETKLPENEVEHLVMKALSLNLIKGNMDQVGQTASINWVQPRVLSHAQINDLGIRLSGWCDKVTAAGRFARQEAPELAV